MVYFIYLQAVNLSRFWLAALPGMIDTYFYFTSQKTSDTCIAFQFEGRRKKKHGCTHSQRAETQIHCTRSQCKFNLHSKYPQRQTCNFVQRTRCDVTFSYSKVVCVVSLTGIKKKKASPVNRPGQLDCRSYLQSNHLWFLLLVLTEKKKKNNCHCRLCVVQRLTLGCLDLFVVFDCSTQCQRGRVSS